jgi:hypothetical protein
LPSSIIAAEATSWAVAVFGLHLHFQYVVLPHVVLVSIVLITYPFPQQEAQSFAMVALLITHPPAPCVSPLHTEMPAHGLQSPEDAATQALFEFWQQSLGKFDLYAAK